MAEQQEKGEEVMTRKDYRKIAGAIRAAREVNNANAVMDVMAVIEAICNVLARDNPRFDREKFLAACGI